MAEAAQRMSRVDTAWLRMDNDVNLMMIVGVWLLTPKVSLQAVRERVSRQAAEVRPLPPAVCTWTPWAPAGSPTNTSTWTHHVAPMPLRIEPGQSERQALQALCAELATDAAGPAPPAVAVPAGRGLRRRQRAGVPHPPLHCRRHCADLGDAVDHRRRRRPAPAAADEHDGDTDWLSDAVVKPLTDLATKAIGMYGDGVSSRWTCCPTRSSCWARWTWRAPATRCCRTLRRWRCCPTIPPPCSKASPIGRKAVAWCEPLPLDQVKAIGKGLGCSVNDVLLSCAAGAIGSYLADHGDDPAGKEIRAMVPVNLRPLEKAWKLGNRFGLAPLTLPVGIDNPIERVFAVRRRMDELKGSYQPLLAFAILSVTGLLIKPAQDAILGLFAKKTTAVMTNVPGPREPLKFCGATLRQNMFWVPASGDVGIGVSILSYAGGVQFGLITDQKLCPDPQEIIDRFGRSSRSCCW
jgi:diacylglycerol O-acyltransferase